MSSELVDLEQSSTRRSRGPVTELAGQFVSRWNHSALAGSEAHTHVVHTLWLVRSDARAIGFVAASTAPHRRSRRGSVPWAGRGVFPALCPGRCRAAACAGSGRIVRRAGHVVGPGPGEPARRHERDRRDVAARRLAGGDGAGGSLDARAAAVNAAPGRRRDRSGLGPVGRTGARPGFAERASGTPLSDIIGPGRLACSARHDLAVRPRDGGLEP